MKKRVILLVAAVCAISVWAHDFEVVTSISNTGYSPTDDELKAAGMTRAEADAWKNYYLAQNAVFSSGSGGSGGSGRRSGGGGGSSSSGSSSSASATSADLQTAASSLASSWDEDKMGYKTLDNGNIDAYIKSKGWNNAQRAAFLGYLSRLGFTYGWNAGR